MSAAKKTVRRNRRITIEALEDRALLAADAYFPIAGDFDGDGIDTAGLVNLTTGVSYLRNENSSGFPQEALNWNRLLPTSVPVAGDWNGSGTDRSGAFDPATNTWTLKIGNADTSFRVSNITTSVTPLAGDFNGDGRDEVALWSPSETKLSIKRSFLTGPAEQEFVLPGLANPASLKVVAGDFNSSPGDEIGLIDEALGRMTLFSTATNQLTAIDGVFRPATTVVGVAGSNEVFAYDHWLSGDWNADGKTDLGRFDSKSLVFAVANNVYARQADSVFYIVPSTNVVPLVGATIVENMEAAPGDNTLTRSTSVPHYPGRTNLSDPADVNADGKCDLSDILAVIYEFNQTTDAEGEAVNQLTFPDVNGDLQIDILDVLAAVYRFNEENNPFAAALFSSSLSSLITDSDVEQLLSRAAAASNSQDAIIAIVDRAGRILGVRVEQFVAPAIQSDVAKRVFAIDGAVAKARTAAFFSNNAAPLTSRTIRFISQSTITQREVESNPTAPIDSNPFLDADQSSTKYGPGFVAPIGLGGHFPPGVTNTPPVDLFGIERQSRDSLVHPGANGVNNTGSVINDDIVLPGRFNVPAAFVPAGNETYAPESYGVQSELLPYAQSRGLATLPGGIPLYKDGNLVGGIGVFFPGPDGFATYEQGFVPGIGQTSEQRLNASRVLEAEWIAFAAAGGSSLAGAAVGNLGTTTAVPPVEGFDLPFGRIDLVGITLEIYGPNASQAFPRKGTATLLAVGQSVGQGNPASGANQAIDGVGNTTQEGVPVGEGWLVLPRAAADGSLTADDVVAMVSQGVAEANLTRAAIRLNAQLAPAGKARMVFSVADKEGNVLGIFRMPDATVFSIDVAVAKARNTAYYADLTALKPDDLVDDDLLIKRGSQTAASLAAQGIVTNGLGIADLAANIEGTIPFDTSHGVAFSNRTFRFLVEPRYPAGIDGTLPPIFSILNDHNLALSAGINPYTAENLGTPWPASRFQSVQGFDSFHFGRNLRDSANIANQNGVVFFPGSSPLYDGGILAGGLGVSGDGVDQDDVVTFAGQQGFAPPDALKSDRSFYRGVRLPFQKFNRNPQG